MADRVRGVDWFAVIADLGRHGYGLQGIAGSIGVPRSTLHGWKQGSKPKHEDGEQLIALWMRVTGRPRDNLPQDCGFD